MLEPSPDVAMIRGRGRLTLTLTTMWRCILSCVASNGACGAGKISLFKVRLFIRNNREKIVGEMVHIAP